MLEIHRQRLLVLVQAEVEEARALKARWERRAEAVARLDGIMEAVRQNPDNLTPSSTLSSSFTISGVSLSVCVGVRVEDALLECEEDALVSVRTMHL